MKVYRVDIGKIIKNKKFKNIAVTILEIIVVAGIIFSALMFLQSKINKEADSASGLTGKGVNEKTDDSDEKKSNSYYIEVNKKLSAVIVYQYSKDKKTKEPVKAFRCSLGKNLSNGSYKISKKYSWLKIYGGWHKYNSGIGKKIWIHSAIYKEKYDYTLSKVSYKSLGSASADGKSILLSAKDSAWIYKNCKNGTKVVIKKGKKKDKLPLSYEPVINTLSKCGWDPTDPAEDNPYQKMKNGKIVKGLGTITVERGHEPGYLSNIIAVNKKGKVITSKLKYNEIDYTVSGTYKVKYRYKTKNGTVYKITQNIKIVDTTPPNVSCSKSLYTLEVKSKASGDVNIQKNVEAIKNMVKAGVICDENVNEIQVYTLEKEQLREGEKIPVVVKAKDLAGNVGSCQVLCEIKAKEAQIKKKYKPSKALEKSRKNKKKSK
jgi:hypothetical protein